MKKFLRVTAALLAVLLAGAALLAVNLTAKTAPVFAEEPLEPLAGEIMSAMLTGEEVPVTQGQLNRMLSLLPPEYRESLQGVELTGENTGAVWGKAEIFGQSCDVRAEVALSFNSETAELYCTVGAVRVGNVPVPEKLVETVLEEQLHGLDFSGRTIIINSNDAARAALGVDFPVVRGLRCDEHAVYLTPAGAGSLLGGWLGGNF